MRIYSVKMKIITLVLCCVILSSLIIGVASILNSRRVVAADSAQIMNQLCENRAAELNALFERIEQSVDTLTVYTNHQLDDPQEFADSDAYVDRFTESLKEVAVNAAQTTEGAITVYIRYNPEITQPKSGLLYIAKPGTQNFVFQEPTNLSV